MSSEAARRVCVAAVAGAWGVRGDVRMKSFTADPTAFAEYGPLETEDGATRYAIRLLRAVAGGFAVRLGGVETREQAEALKGTRLYASRDRLPPLPDDEFYHADLLGLPVFDTGGVPLGRVAAVQDYGGGDFIEVARPGQNALLLPFTRQAVPTVDLAAGRIVADPPDEIVADGPPDDIP